MDERDRLIGYLNGRDVPCPGCGYNLRGLRDTACPECDEPLSIRSIRYARKDPRTASFVVGAAGFVPAALLLVWIWLDAWNWPRYFPRGRLPNASDLPLVVLIVLTLGVVGGFWKWFDWADEMAGRSAGFRWGWAAVCWSAVPLALASGRLMGRW
ncbi:MAG: hypothetical protein AAGA55_09475 [Planctomycetota bacterium]